MGAPLRTARGESSEDCVTVKEYEHFNPRTNEQKSLTGKDATSAFPKGKVVLLGIRRVSRAPSLSRPALWAKLACEGGSASGSWRAEW